MQLQFGTLESIQRRAAYFVVNDYLQTSSVFYILANWTTIEFTLKT